jgi:hypothetical protein
VYYPVVFPGHQLAEAVFLILLASSRFSSVSSPPARTAVVGGPYLHFVPLSTEQDAALLAQAPGTLSGAISLLHVLFDMFL